MKALFRIAIAAALLAASIDGAGRGRVTIRVDASPDEGPMTPMWALFGYDEPNYTYMKDGKKLLVGAGRAQSRAGVRPRAQPADDRRRHAGAEVGIDQRLHRRRAGPPDLRLDDRRSHLRHLRRAEDEAARRDRLHAGGAVDQAAALQARLGAGGPATTASTPAGPIRRRTTTSGASSISQWVRHSRRALRPAGSRELVLGSLERAGHRVLAGHARGIPEALRLRGGRPEARAADGAHRRAARHGAERRPHAEDPSRFPRALPARHELRDRQDRVAARLHRAFTPRGRRASSTDTCGWAISNQLRAISNGFQIVASFPELQEHADHHRRVGSGGLRGLLVATNPENAYRNGTMYSSYTAAQIARTYELADLHKVNLLRIGDVGVRVRGPAVFRRVPRSGDQRDRQAGPERVPDARPDGRRSRCRSRAAAPRRWTSIRDNGVREQPDVNALATRSERDGLGPRLELSRRRPAGAGGESRR